MCGERGVLMIVKKNGFCYAGLMNTILKYFIRSIFLIFPVIFIPIVIDGFGFGKNLALAVLAFVALILWTIKLIIDKEKIVKTNKLFWLFLVFVIWSGVTFFRLDTGSRMMSLMNPMGIGTVISFFVLFFVWLQVNDKEETKKQFLFLTIAGLITGIVSLIVFLLPVNKLPLLIPKNNPLMSITAVWSLVGSVWGEATLFIFLIFGWLKKLLKKVKEKSDFNSYWMEALATIFFSLLFLLDIYRIFKAGWTFLDLKSAWIIAAETFKVHPFFGMGIGNFLEAFNSYRPASFNLTNMWTTSFTSSSMGILQIWTELGVVGLGLVLYLVAMVMKLKRTNNFWQLVLFLVISLFLPLNLVTVFLLLWILSNNLPATKETKLILNVGEKNFNVMPYVVAVLILVGVGFGGYWMTRIFLGDVYMRKSLVAASKNDGTKTYELQIKAIGFNPNVPSYRKTYSQVNLSLASTLLSNKDISDDDKQKASTLVQQAVREAKAAVTLSQKNPEYWYNLAGIYKSLVGLVDGAADWSYQAYQQTVILDPVNPTYYLDMGGLLYAAGSYESAERAFEQAATTKTNYANAWYNWAYAAKQQNKLSAAVSRLTQALTLVPNDSSDYTTASKELESWKAELATLTKQQAEATKSAQTQTDTNSQAQQAQPVEQMQQQQTQPIQQQTEQQKTPVDGQVKGVTTGTGAEEKVNVPADQFEAKPTTAEVMPAQ
jgi:tetratricopeptide (TPR) repeat protein